MGSSKLIVAWIVALCLAASASAQSLTPQQRAGVRQARNLVIDCETQAGRLEYHLARIEANGTRTDTKTIQEFNASAGQFSDSFLRAETIFDSLPTGDATVDDLRARHGATAGTYQQSLARAERAMNDAEAAVADAGGLEAIAADLGRLREIAGQFDNFGNGMSEAPEESRELLLGLGPAVDEVKAFEAKYADFLAVDNADSAPVRRQLEAAKQTLRQALADARGRAGEVRESATSFLDRAEELIATGVAESRPLYFVEDGSVAGSLEAAEGHVRLAELIDAASAAPLVARHERVAAEARRAGKSLEAQILAANAGPKDAYAGADRDALLAGATAAWAEAYPDDQILKVTLPPARWKRDAKWTWGSDAFHYTDRSELWAAVVVEVTAPGGEAELHALPVYIRKDHRADDAVRFSPWEKRPLDDTPISFRFLPDKP